MTLKTSRDSAKITESSAVSASQLDRTTTRSLIQFMKVLNKTGAKTLMNSRSNWEKCLAPNPNCYGILRYHQLNQLRKDTSQLLNPSKHIQVHSRWGEVSRINEDWLGLYTTSCTWKSGNMPCQIVNGVMHRNSACTHTWVDLSVIQMALRQHHVYSNVAQSCT